MFRATMCPSSGETNCVFATLGTCYSVWMTVWYAGLNETHSTLHTRQSRLNIYIYTGCPERNVPGFGRMFLKLKYTDLTKNTYIRS